MHYLKKKLIIKKIKIPKFVKNEVENCHNVILYYNVVNFNKMFEYFEILKNLLNISIK